MIETVKNHPSQIQVGISRISGGDNEQFYGSDIETNSYILLTVSESEYKRRSLGNDYFFATRTILELKMTNLQYAEMLTTMNVGMGVPATLIALYADTLPQGHIEPPLVENKVELLEKELEVASEGATVKLDELSGLINKLKISQKQKDELLKKVSATKYSLVESITFRLSQAKKELGKMTVEAKASLEGFYTSLCLRLGVKTLKNASVKLIDNKDER